jgi:NADH-ubiquinone oxidoreductase chain 6
MFNLYNLTEYSTKGFDISIVYSIFIFSIITSIFVIITKNPVLSVLFLILLFLIMSGYLMLLGATFIGLSYILVYVGAVSILFLFILMLINIRISELISNTNNSWALSIIVGYIFFTTIGFGEIISYCSQYTSDYSNLINFTNINNNVNIKFSTSVSWDNNLIEMAHISTIGNVIYTDYFLWLILSSIILLLAMIGAIIITITEVKPTKTVFKL